MHEQANTMRKQTVILFGILTAIVLVISYVLLSRSFLPQSIMNRNANIINNFDNNIRSVIEHAEPIYFPKELDPAEKNRATKVPILMYHDVVAEKPEVYDGNKLFVEDFRAQMKYLVDNGYRTLTLEEFDQFYRSEIELPKKVVMLTFDDGFKTIKDVIEPILIEYNLHAISFVIGEKSMNEPMYFMDTAGMQELKQRNFVEFQSHSYGLHNWTDKSRGMVETASLEDIVADKQLLEGVVGNDVSFFCYPFGHSGGTAQEYLLGAGYRYAVTIEDGIATRKTDAMQLPRVRINANTTLEQYAARLIV